MDTEEHSLIHLLECIRQVISTHPHLGLQPLLDSEDFLRQIRGPAVNRSLQNLIAGEAFQIMMEDYQAVRHSPCQIQIRIAVRLQQSLEAILAVP